MGELYTGTGMPIITDETLKNYYDIFSGDGNHYADLLQNLRVKDELLLEMVALLSMDSEDPCKVAIGGLSSYDLLEKQIQKNGGYLPQTSNETHKDITQLLLKIDYTEFFVNYVKKVLNENRNYICFVSSLAFGLKSLDSPMESFESSMPEEYQAFQQSEEDSVRLSLSTGMILVYKLLEMQTEIDKIRKQPGVFLTQNFN